MAAIYWGNNESLPPLTPLNESTVANTALKQTQRAKVIALHDFVKSELPDVFFVQNATGDYPLNFAAEPYPGTAMTTSPHGNYVLPLGNSVTGPFTSQLNGYGDGNTFNPAGTGIYGASYPIAAAIYKNLGYLPTGCDSVDNNGDGQVDEAAEGVNTTNSALVQGNLERHIHSTARAEMLYAVLVEGTGPLGSVFNRDDFTDREVQDTDNDGLPEFVDAWGQPLLFFRWPILFHSDIQKGQLTVSPAKDTWVLEPPYFTAGSPLGGQLEQREQDPLDPNQQLVAPAWWSQFGVGNSYGNAYAPFSAGPASTTMSASTCVAAFESFFHRLSEPVTERGGAGSAVAVGRWDRGSQAHFYNRRAFYSRFLILSSGLDHAPGVFRYADSDIATLAAESGAQTVATYLIANENNALPFGLDMFTGTNKLQGLAAGGLPVNAGFTTSNTSVDPTHPGSFDLMQAAQDDISNHNLEAGGALGGSG